MKQSALYDFFIAHGAADRESAERLFECLRPRTSVFLAVRMQPGVPWDKTIANAQRASRATIILLSSHIEESYYLAEEIAAAINLHRRGQHRIIPILLEPLQTDQVPYGLRRLQHLPVKTSIEETAEDIERMLRQVSTSGGVASAACSRARIPYVASSGESVAVDLWEGDSLTIGRGRWNNVSFDDPRVSTVHAELSLRNGSLCIRDCGSKNHLFINGVKINDSSPLMTGDVIRFGRHGPEMLVIEGGQLATETDPLTQDSGANS